MGYLGGYLIDTHCFLWAIKEPARLSKRVSTLLAARGVQIFISVASLWEIAIKVRINKLQLVPPLSSLDVTCRAFNLGILSIESGHVLAEVTPLPATRDPFDRLLLAQAGVEGMRLVTLDHALVGHPLAWTP